MKSLKIKTKKTVNFKIIGLGLIIFVILGVISDIRKANNKDSEVVDNKQAELSSTKPAVLNYEKLKYEDVGNVENLAFLYTGTDKSKEYLENIAKEIKSNECKKPCNVDLYDDKSAFDLQQQYDQMMGSFDTKQSELDSWKKKNYVFVADHLLGYLEFSDEAYFNYYPYKDWYYKELKN